MGRLLLKVINEITELKQLTDNLSRFARFLRKPLEIPLSLGNANKKTTNEAIKVTDKIIKVAETALAVMKAMGNIIKLGVITTIKFI